MIQDFIEARQRVLANDDPEKIKGKKWGYVREGNRWYPAVTESESKDEGYGTNRSVLMIKYGDNLKWEKDKEGAWYPTFDHVKFKEFHVSTDEIYGAKAGNEYRERKDPLRDFYFLGDEETSAMLQNFAGGSLMQKYSQDDDHKFTPEEQAEYQSAQATAFSSFEQHDDRGWRESWRPQNEGGNARFVDGSWQTEVDAYGKNYAPLADSMQDSRAAIDMIHDWKHSAKGGVSRGDEDFWEGSILLRRVVNEQGSIGTAPWAAAPRLMPLQNSNRVSYADMPEVLQYYGGPKRDSYIRSKGLSRNTDDWGGAGNPQSWFGGQAENNFYIEQFYSHMKMLYASQKQAATTMGFKDRYHFDALSSDEIAAKYPDQFWYLNMINANGWYHMYLDNSWDMPEIKTAQQLHDELLDIEEAGDAEHIGSTHYRNSQQQEYLAQKAIVRYWAQKIDGLGGGPQLLSALQGSEEYVNGPPPFWQAGDDPNDAEGYGLGWHYGADDDVETPIEGVAEERQQTEDADKALREKAVAGYAAWGLTSGANDPDFIAGRWGDDYQAYWDSTGREAPYEFDDETQTMVQQVWDQAKMQWVLPSDVTPPPGPEVQAVQAVGMRPEGEWTEASEMQTEVTDFPDREGWHYNQTDNVIIAPDGTKFAADDSAGIWFHEQDLLDAAAAASEAAQAAAEAAKELKAAEEAATAAEDAAAKAAEDEAAQAAQAAAEKLDEEQKAADEKNAAAAAAARAKQDQGTTHTQGAEPEDPGHSNVGTFTFHHEDMMQFHHDATVPMHIPSVNTAAAVPLHMPHVKTI